MRIRKTQINIYNSNFKSDFVSVFNNFMLRFSHRLVSSWTEEKARKCSASKCINKDKDTAYVNMQLKTCLMLALGQPLSLFLSDMR